MARCDAAHTIVLSSRARSLIVSFLSSVRAAEAQVQSRRLKSTLSAAMRETDMAARLVALDANPKSTSWTVLDGLGWGIEGVQTVSTTCADPSLRNLSKLSVHLGKRHERSQMIRQLVESSIVVLKAEGTGSWARFL